MAELDIPITVTGLQGRPIATTAPADGQALIWSQSASVWGPVTPPFLPLAGGSLTGNLTVGGNLNVAGALTSVTALQTSGNAAVGGTLTSTGLATLSAGLNVAGGLTSVTALQTSGNITVGGTATINGSLTFAGLTFTNNGGAIYSTSNIATAGELISQTTVGVNGITLSNASGALAVNATINSGQSVVCPPSGQFNVGGLYWTYSSGYMWCNASVQANAFVEYSNPSIKRDIRPAESGALDKIKSVEVKNYKLDHESHGLSVPSDPLFTGFDATEVASSIPEAVRHDENGEVIGYSVSDMTALLWKAVQELSAQVSELQAKG
jgi:hypothetical protein